MRRAAIEENLGVIKRKRVQLRLCEQKLKRMVPPEEYAAAVVRASAQFRVLPCAARTLTGTGYSRVTLSLQ